MSSVIEVPDWYRTVALVGVDITGEPVVVLLDSTGAIMAVMKGEYAGTLKNIAVDASGRIVSVIRDPTSDNYIAIDANGYIAAVLKATYSGTLKNVACDSEGRIIMIPTDPADVWGNAISMGNAELAAVLSPAKRFDRRGNLVFFDNFESGLGKGIIDAVGSGADVVLTSSESREGAFSCKLVGGSTLGKYARYFYWLGYRPASKLGVECHFRLSANVAYFTIDLYAYDGTKYHRGSISYDPANDKYIYCDSAGVWQDLLTSKTHSESASYFYPIKLVIDPVNDLYVRALIAGQEVNMSAYALPTGTSTLIPDLYANFRVDSLGATNPAVYIDAVIVTQNELA